MPIRASGGPNSKCRAYSGRGERSNISLTSCARHQRAVSALWGHSVRPSLRSFNGCDRPWNLVVASGTSHGRTQRRERFRRGCGRHAGASSDYLIRGGGPLVHTRQQFLSIIASNFGGTASFISGLMTWGIDEARKHAFQKKPGQTVDRPVTARTRLNAVKVDHFIDILSSPSFLQDVASWPKTLKLLYLVESSWKLCMTRPKDWTWKIHADFECMVLSFSISEDPYPPPQRNAPKTGLPLHPQSRTPSW